MSEKAPPYLHRPLPTILVLVVAPLLALVGVVWGWKYVASDTGLGDLSMSWPYLAYQTLLASTHFFITATLYMSIGNLRRFTADPASIVQFFVIPGALLLGMWGFGTVTSGGGWPTAVLLVAVLIRAADFYHLTRQAFGVLQLQKFGVDKFLPAQTRSLENSFLLSIALLLYSTFLAGGAFDPAFRFGWICLALTVGLGLAVAGCYAIGVRNGAPLAVMWRPIAYLTVQVLCASASVVWIGFYGFSLAVHYMEYHVLMGPRTLQIPLDATSAPDRVLGFMQRFPAILYAAILGMALTFLAIRLYAAADPQPTGIGTRTLVHVYDGLFVWHYFVEMWVWKMSDPHWRKQLIPLYA